MREATSNIPHVCLQGFSEFQERVRNVSRTVLNNSQEILVTSFVANLYDSVLLYGRALQSLLDQGTARREVTGRQVISNLKRILLCFFLDLNYADNANALLNR